MQLSIVTINYNNALGLKKTLDSVLHQTATDFEHIIIDGGSTDGSVEVIKEYVEQSNSKFQIPNSKLPTPSSTISWVSEPDKGIYNAMNKGIRMASGEYIEILNSGDCFAADDVVKRMAEALTPNGYPELLYGNMTKIMPDGTVVGKSGFTEYSLRQFYSSTLNHDCAWIKRSLFEKYGLYDESLKIVSDWKWYLQSIGLGHVKPVYTDIDVTLFDCEGISEKNLALRNAERRQVLEDVMPPAILADYDKHAFETQQVDRIRKHHLYPLFYFVERVIFKLEKWKILR